MELISIEVKCFYLEFRNSFTLGMGEITLVECFVNLLFIFVLKRHFHVQCWGFQHFCVANKSTFSIAFYCYAVLMIGNWLNIVDHFAMQFLVKPMLYMEQNF